METWKGNPVQFVTDVLGVKEIEEWQREALMALPAQDRIAIRSGHGVGKSAYLSWVILWWLVTHFPAKVACTAPTAHQLSDVLWGEVAKWHRKMLEPFKSWLTVKSETIELALSPQESFAVARTARRETPETFQGFHSDNMLFLVDEASGVDEIIFEVGQGAMSTAGAKTLMAGNPTQTSGHFFNAFHKNRQRWWTQKVSSLDSTRVGPDYAEEVADTYGIDSNVYRVRVLGEFPTGEDDSVIPVHLCESALVREVEPSEAYNVVWGLDVARFGDDATALAKRRGNVLLEPVKVWRGLDLMQTVGRVVDEYRQTYDDMRPSEIIVDVIGIGAGVVDRLHELKLAGVRGLNVGEMPAAKERFSRKRDELWFEGREWLDKRDCKLPDDDALIAELTGPKYSFLSNGKLKVESKDDMKKRGLHSPDRADAFLLTLAGGMDINESVHMDRYEKARKKRRRGSAWSV